MNNTFLYNSVIFISICILIYFVFSNIGVKEGMETKSTNSREEHQVESNSPGPNNTQHTQHEPRTPPAPHSHDSPTRSARNSNRTNKL